MQPRPAGQHRVDEGPAHVDAPSRGAQHPLRQVGQLPGAQDGVVSSLRLRRATSPARLVDPEVTRDARLRAVIDETWT